ncbi:MAG TPA: hypothetical protein VFD43_01095, partial [Planctomycetota bacterium]|nr:hypothetical protein [Planctomycetota bacterium]
MRARLRGRRGRARQAARPWRRLAIAARTRVLAAPLGLAASLAAAACAGAPATVAVKDAPVALDAPSVLELLPNRLPVVSVDLD